MDGLKVKEFCFKAHGVGGLTGSLLICLIVCKRLPTLFEGEADLLFKFDIVFGLDLSRLASDPTCRCLDREFSTSNDRRVDIVAMGWGIVVNTLIEIFNEQRFSAVA